LGLAFWAFFARRPALYRLAAALVMRALGNLGHAKGRFRRLPLASGWTAARDLPAPEGETFMTLWADRQKGRAP
jgi:L-lactate dehydrogenase complex protein LldF